MELKDLAQQIKELEAASTVDVSGLPWSTRAGAEANVRIAKRDLEIAKKEYAGLVASQVLLIGVRGPASEDFARISRDKLRTLAADHSGLNKALVQKIKARGAQTEYGSFENNLLLGELLNLRTELEIVALPGIPEQTSQLFYFQPLEQAVSGLMRRAFKNSLTTVWLRRQIEVQALNSLFDGKVLPVVVYNYDESIGIDPEFLPMPVAVIEAKGQLSIEKVKKELLKVKSTLKPSAKAAEAEAQPNSSEETPEEDNQQSTEDLTQENPNV